MLLKNISKESSCIKTIFKAIPCGVKIMLEKITLCLESSSTVRVNEFYPDHYMAEKKEEINLKIISTLRELWESTDK